MQAEKETAIAAAAAAAAAASAPTPPTPVEPMETDDAEKEAAIFEFMESLALAGVGIQIPGHFHWLDFDGFGFWLFIA